MKVVLLYTTNTT